MAAFGPLAALIALNNAPPDQRVGLATQFNQALQQDIAASGGNTAFSSSAMTTNLDAAIGGVAPGSGSNVPQFSFDDIFPSSIPMSGITATAGVTPASAETGGSPVATGFELFRETFDMLMQAEQARRQGIDQQINIASLFSELSRASPSQAAELAVRTGLTGMEPNLDWANAFSTGAHTTFGGEIGSQNVSLPWSFSGHQLSFLRDRPNVERMLMDVADFLGRPDILSESMNGLIPANRSLIGMAG